MGNYTKQSCLRFTFYLRFTIYLRTLNKNLTSTMGNYTWQNFRKFVFELRIKKLTLPMGKYLIQNFWIFTICLRTLNNETGFTNGKLQCIKLLNAIHNLSSNSEEYGVLFLDDEDSIISLTCRNTSLFEGVIFSRISNSRSSRGITSKLYSNFLAIFSASCPNFSASSYFSKR